MQLKVQRAIKAPKQDPDVVLVKEKLEQFGRRWEVQSCAAGSSDPSCLLQAAKSLAALIVVLEQHKAAAHRPQTRHAATQEVPWGPLLGALLDASAPAAVISLALPAASALVGFMPEVVPASCCAALVSLLDPPANTCGDGPTGQLAAGAHAVACLTALIPVWRTAALQPHWASTRGSVRLRAHLGRCVAATNAAAASTAGSRTAAATSASSGAAATAALAQLTATLRFTLTLVRLGSFVRSDILAGIHSWVSVLLGAHEAAAVAATLAATAAGAQPQAPSAAARARGEAAAGGRASAGAAEASLEAQALVLELLRLLSMSRRLWSAVLPSTPSVPPCCPHQAVDRPLVVAAAAVSASSGQRAPAVTLRTGGGVGGGGGGGPDRGISGSATHVDSGNTYSSGGPTPAGRLLATLSVHLRPRGSGGSSPLLPSAAALLCHPGLWRAGAGHCWGAATGDEAEGSGGGSGGGGMLGNEASPFRDARKEVIEAALSCLAACGPAGSSCCPGPAREGPTAASALGTPPVGLLPVLGAALMPPSVPYGSKAVEWELPCSPLWDQALAPVLALAVRAILGGGGCGRSTSCRSSSTTATPPGAPGDLIHSAKGASEGAGGGLEGTEAAAAAAAGWLLLRLLAPRATHGSVEAAAAIAARWDGDGSALSAVAGAPLATAPGAAAAVFDSGAAAGPWDGVPTEAAPAAEAVAAAAVTRAVVGQFAVLGGGHVPDTGVFNQNLIDSTCVPGFVRVLSGQPTSEAHRRLLRLQLLFSAATVSAAAAAAAATASATSAATPASGPSRQPQQRIGNQERPPSLQQLQRALLGCCQALLSASPPPGALGPSLALHGCLGAALHTARAQPPAGGCRPEAPGAPPAEASPAGCGGGQSSSLAWLLAALASGPARQDGPWGGGGGSDPAEGGLAAAPGPGPGPAQGSSAAPHEDVMDPGWARWWWREAREAVRGCAAAANRAAAAAGAPSAVCRIGQRSVGAALRGTAAPEPQLRGEGTAGSTAAAAAGNTSAVDCRYDSSYDSYSGSSSSSSDEGSSSDGGGGAAGVAAGGPSCRERAGLSPDVTAPAAFCTTVRQMLWSEIHTYAAALLSLRFGVLNSSAGVQAEAAAAGAARPLALWQGADGGVAEGDVGVVDGGSGHWAGTSAAGAPFGMPGVEAAAEFADACFSFGAAAASPAGYGEPPLTPPPPPPPQSVTRASAALVTAGCPALGVKLRQALLQLLASQAGGGSGSGERTAAVAVLSWPQTVKVQMGSKVPVAAFRAVLDYLTAGFADLPYREPDRAAEAAREVAALAAALDLPHLRALARGAPPRPGCRGPPPTRPSLPPLLPRCLLLLPAPPPAPPPPPSPQRPQSEQQQAELRGRQLQPERLPPASREDAAAATPPTRGSPGCALPAARHVHPLLEEQLAAIAQWEQDQDLLARVMERPSSGPAAPQPHPQPEGHSYRHPAVDMRCLVGDVEAPYDTCGCGCGRDSGGDARPCPGPWPHDCVLAVPLLLLLPSPAGAEEGQRSSGQQQPGCVGPEEAEAAAAAAAAAQVAAPRCGSAVGGGSGGAVACRTVFIPSHRVVLAAGSEYFSALCSDRWAAGVDVDVDVTGGGGGGTTPELYLRAAERDTPAWSSSQSSGRASAAVVDTRPASAAAAAAAVPQQAALRVKLLRVPGCDAEAALAVLHYLHLRTQTAFRAADSWRPARLWGPASAVGCGCGEGLQGRRPRRSAAAVAAAPMRWEVPLVECEWAPVAPATAVAGGSRRHVAGDRGADGGAGCPSVVSREANEQPGGDGSGSGSGSDNGSGNSSGSAKGEDRGVSCCAQLRTQAAVEAQLVPPGGPSGSLQGGSCPHCRELRLCLRVLLACNALMLPELEGRVTRRVLQVLRRRRCWRRRRRRPCGPGEESDGGGSSRCAGSLRGGGGDEDADEGLRVGCLLTAVRDGAVLQLTWLVAAAMEQLVERHTPQEAGQAAEWQQLPERLQREARDRWVVRARGDSVIEGGRHGWVVGSEPAGRRAAGDPCLSGGLPGKKGLRQPLRSQQQQQQQQQQTQQVMVAGRESLRSPGGAAGCEVRTRRGEVEAAGEGAAGGGQDGAAAAAGDWSGGSGGGGFTGAVRVLAAVIWGPGGDEGGAGGGECGGGGD